MKKLTLSLLVVLIFGSHLVIAQSHAEINWPSGFAPEEARFFVWNELEINAPAQMVWEELIRAEAWPDWYEGAENVRIISSTSPQKLTTAARFEWSTMGFQFTSEIKEFVPHERLSWVSMKKSIQGYHAWLIIPTASGCKVITAESQNGWLVGFEKTFQPKKLYRLHGIWLAELKKRIESNNNSSSSSSESK